MVNKGKGCLSAIFDGSIPIGIVKHGLDTVFSKGEPSPLDDYTILEAIYGNGKQYAIIDYYANQNTKVEMKFAYKNNASNPANLFTSRSSSTSGMFSFLPYEGGSKKTRSAFGTKNIDFTLTSINTVHTVVKDGIYTYVDGELKATHTAATFTSTNPMYVLFQPSSTATPLEATIYYMKIWDNGTLVHDLIPVKEKSTGIVGLFDKITNEFITSETSTEFIAVNKPIETNYNENGLLANYIGRNSAVGTTWFDSSANGNNITMYNNPTFDSEIFGWVFGGGNTKQYGKASITPPKGDFTIEMYGLVPDMSSYSRIVTIVGHTWNALRGYGIQGMLTDGSNVRTSAFFTTSNGSGKSYPLYLDGIWGANIKTKFVLRRNQTGGIFNQYVKNINGNKTQEDTISTASVTAEQNAIIIGTQKDASSSASDFGKGTMFAVRVYDRYLTDEEIAQNHAEDVRLYGE